MLLIKKLLCLSLLFSISLISNQLSASTPVIVGGTIVAIVHVPAVTVAASVAGVIGAGYGTYRVGKYLWRKFISPSQVKVLANDLSKANDIANIVKKQTEIVIEENLEQIVKKVKELSAEGIETRNKLEALQKGSIQKIKEGAIALKNAVPVKLRENIEKKCKTTVNILKNAVGFVYKITIKDHPYLTVTAVIVATIYVINKKCGKKIRQYGKKAKEIAMSTFAPKKLAIEQSQSIGTGNNGALITL